MTTLQEKIAIMQAFADGKAIEYTAKEVSAFSDWEPVAAPRWDWPRVEYRVAKSKHVVYASLVTGANATLVLGKTHPTLERAQAAGLNGVPIATITWEE